MQQRNSIKASIVRNKIGNPEIATTIISLVFSCSKSEALMMREMPENMAKKCLRIAVAHKKGQPIAYLTKKWFFYGLPMYINTSVLIPRMDTEILVESVISESKKSNPKILDLCTGSGCIAIALAKNLPNATVFASDISPDALRVAKRNAKMNEVQVQFYQGDLFEATAELYDIIVSNPPYIKTDEIGMHDPSTLNEPVLALDGGSDGLDFYRRIVAGVKNHLVQNGQIAFEIGHNQAEAVSNLLQESGFRDIKIIQDLNGLNRVITARS